MKTTIDGSNYCCSSSRHSLLRLLATISSLMLTLSLSYAGSSTWSLSPISGNWNTAANWTPPTVPNGESDIATFATSNRVTLSVSKSTTVDRIVFDSGASQFTITVLSPWILFLDGLGVVNNSGAEQ